MRKYRDVKAAYVGEPGTPERNQFELELTLELLPLKIKEFRKEQRLIQAELGARLGVHRAQISKLERNPVNVSVDTLLKAFAALHTKIKIGFEAVPPGPPHLAVLLLSALLQALAHQPGIFCGQAPSCSSFAAKASVRRKANRTEVGAHRRAVRRPCAVRPPIVSTFFRGVKNSSPMAGF